jgi:hypothetical protein
VHWIGRPARPFDRRYPNIVEHRDFPSQEAADAEKKFLAQCFGPEACVHVTPVFITRQKRAWKYKKAQTDAGWPVRRKKLT